MTRRIAVAFKKVGKVAVLKSLPCYKIVNFKHRHVLRWNLRDTRESESVKAMWLERWRDNGTRVPSPDRACTSRRSKGDYSQRLS